MTLSTPVRGTQPEHEDSPEASVLDRPLVDVHAIPWEAVAYGLLVLLALVLRLANLGDKPFHHDESQDAYFAYIFYSGGGYKYNPLLHGPLRFYLIALMYLLFGVSDFTARLAPALLGTVMVALPYFLRRQLGRVAAFATAVLLCISPSYLYFSRFTREDIYFACLTLALIVATFSFLQQPRPWQPALILGLLAASFATKETTYITVFIAGLFFLATLARQALDARKEGLALRDLPLIRTMSAPGRDPWLWAFATFVIVYVLLFTTFLTNPQGLYDGVVKGLQYWLAQQPVGRGDEPWYYYFVLLPAYEWPEIILGGVGVAWVLRRPTLLGVFLIWFFTFSMGIYSWAGEKMPWLLIHPLLPLLFLAGLGFQALWQRRHKLAGLGGLAITALGAVYLIHAATAVSFVHPADPAELLVYTQSSTAVPRVNKLLHEISQLTYDATGKPLQVAVDTTDGTDWPWAWYFRNLNVSYVAMSQPGFKPSTQALIIDDPNRAAHLSELSGYTGFKFPLRVWWIPDFARASVQTWLTWLYARTPWNPLGSLDEWVYVRNDTPGVALIGGAPALAGASTGTVATTATVPADNLPPAVNVTPVRIIAPQANGKFVLHGPRQLTVLPDGTIFVVNQDSGTVDKIAPNGAVVAQYVGTGRQALKLPTGLAVDSQGNVFIADTWNHRIVMLSKTLQFVRAWGSFAATNGQLNAAPGKFYGPRSIAIDKQDHLFVTDTGNKRVEEFDESGKLLYLFGGGGSAPGQLSEPVGIAFTPDGNLVIADTWNRRLQLMTPQGQPLAQWPVVPWQTNVHNEPYVAVGQDGIIYVTNSDAKPGSIYVFSPRGLPLAVWHVAGTALNYPTGLAIGPGNQLYVSDSGNQRIVVLPGR
ncbi:MAG: TIGR03663 family protein [Chloroflexi bacterium]|nr:TIGR03663 family protein [Chloroflexota bacterium]